MAFFTDKFLNARREDLLRHIYRFQYQLNGDTWYTGEINSKEVVGTNVVVFVNMPSSGAADTVTAVRVYDNNDSLAGSQSVNLKRQSYNTGLLRFTFPLIEATTEQREVKGNVSAHILARPGRGSDRPGYPARHPARPGAL